LSEFLTDAPIGMTQYMERLRWNMALQRQIELQLNGFEQVLASRVLLSRSEESLFAEDQVDPSASVYLQLERGSRLSVGEGLRIASMVAAAVPGLISDRVAILDSEMRVIHAMRDDGQGMGTSSQLAELQRYYDSYYTRKIERLLERIVGLGNVVAQVNVELDPTETTIRQRELDAEGAVVISSRTREATTSGAKKGGVPGTTANSPELSGVDSRGSRSSNEADEVSNIDVPEKNTYVASLPGGILSITASVFVDGTWAVPEPADATTDASEADPGAAAKKVYTPRTAEDLAQYREAVAAAIGTPLGSVTMINQPFSPLELEPLPPKAGLGVQDWAQHLPWGAVALAILLTFLFVVRPTMQSIAAQPAAQIADEAERALTDGGVAGALSEPEEIREEQEHQELADWLDSIASGDGGFVTRSEVTRLVRTDLVHSVVTLQNWISHETVA
jgi:flagellar M-ring protein FliF